mgnify:CR=1 FL=1
MLKKIFSNFSKKHERSILENYDIDLHSHLIPGIDDGVQTMAESIEIISHMKELGFKKIITAPIT